jgi:hypothetical protein
MLAETLARTLVLGAALEELKAQFGTYDLRAHWTQGEFHHDLVVETSACVVVIATNCNGGIKEVLVFSEVPERYALWRWRCPHVSDFAGELAPILQRAITPHWFDPCEILAENARSELREEFRERQKGGGWTCRNGD